MKNKKFNNTVILSLVLLGSIVGARVVSAQNATSPIPSAVIPQPPIAQAFPPVASPPASTPATPNSIPPGAPIPGQPQATSVAQPTPSPTPIAPQPAGVPPNPSLPPPGINIPVATPTNMPPLVSPVAPYSPSSIAQPSATPQSNEIRSGIETTITPTLRELAVIKAQLQLVNARKELKKAEDDLYGRNKEENKSDGPSSGPKEVKKEGPVVITAEMQKAQTEALRFQQQAIAASLAPPPPAEVTMKVYSVTGFKDKMTAKVQFNKTKSIQVVKVGEELPDGGIIKEINQNFVLVQMSEGKTKKTERYYVEGGDPGMSSSSTPGGAPSGPNPNAPRAPAVPNTANQSSATNIPPNTNPILQTIPRK